MSVFVYLTLASDVTVVTTQYTERIGRTCSSKLIFDVFSDVRRISYRYIMVLIVFRMIFLKYVCVSITVYFIVNPALRTCDVMS